MQEYVYVHPFGKYLVGDHVELDVPAGTVVPNALSVDDPRVPAMVGKTPDESDLGGETKPVDDAEEARQAAIAEAEKNLAAATAAEDEAHSA